MRGGEGRVTGAAHSHSAAAGSRRHDYAVERADRTGGWKEELMAGNSPHGISRGAVCVGCIV